MITQMSLSIIPSPYLFTEHEQLSYTVENLIFGFVEMYVPLSYVSHNI